MVCELSSFQGASGSFTLNAVATAAAAFPAEVPSPGSRVRQSSQLGQGGAGEVSISGYPLPCITIPQILTVV